MFLILNSYGFQRKLYVDEFNNILGSYNQEKELLEFSKKNNIHTLILYELNKVHKRFSLENSNKNKVLANFISRAKLKYDIKKISASGENAKFFVEAIHPYNQSRKKDIEKFDVYNLEYEYWNKQASLNGGYYCETYLKEAQIPCNRVGSFNFYLGTLTTMKLLAKEQSHPIKIEAYIGQYTNEEVFKISNNVDRLLIAAYVDHPARSFEYVKDRLKLLSKIKSKIEISLIFSSEMDFMGSWLRKNHFKNAEKIFFEELNIENKNLTKDLNFHGFTYYNYSYFKKALSGYKINSQKSENTYVDEKY
ncbi:hypothetical protein BTO16_06475 [Polaribacter glomeratus]|uniref:Uncharacterized protein n=2 Tax=Polaribacter glomeratus TaxID=102 RepID=A0A2S7WY29_9FLAO|nr:hypothetical protein BTO16_06475 [Polaribacter glomeratus]